jgi:hypothetical protein
VYNNFQAAMTTLSAINPLSSEFQSRSAEVLAEETEIIDGANLHLSLVRSDALCSMGTQQRCDTTQGAIIGPHEILYHLHLSDGTCVSTALCQSDKTVYQLFPEPLLFANRIDWAALALIHFADQSQFVIHNDIQLKSDHLVTVRAERYKQIVDATLLAKETGEPVGVDKPELDIILGFLKLDDDEFFGEEESKEDPNWMIEAHKLTKSYNPAFPGCIIKNIVKRTLYDEKDIAIAKNAAQLAFVMCDHKRLASKRAE